MDKKECINREYLIKTLTNNADYKSECGYERTVDLDSLIKYIKGLPTADVAPRSEWVSVEIRLPEEDIRVLVCVNSERSYTKVDTDRMSDGKWVRWGTDVTHWMPLPEPPRVKEREK